MERVWRGKLLDHSFTSLLCHITVHLLYVHLYTTWRLLYFLIIVVIVSRKQEFTVPATFLYKWHLSGRGRVHPCLLWLIVLKTRKKVWNEINLDNVVGMRCDNVWSFFCFVLFFCKKKDSYTEQGNSCLSPLCNLNQSLLNQHQLLWQRWEKLKAQNRPYSWVGFWALQVCILEQILVELMGGGKNRYSEISRYLAWQCCIDSETPDIRYPLCRNNKRCVL